MVDPGQPGDPPGPRRPTDLTAGLPAFHRVTLSRGQLRRATPGRSVPPGSVTFAAVEDASGRRSVWLDVAGRNGGSGILFTAEGWARLVLEAASLLQELG